MVNPSRWNAVCYELGGKLFWLCLQCANCRYSARDTTSAVKLHAGGNVLGFKSVLCDPFSFEKDHLSTPETETGQGVHTAIASQSEANFFFFPNKSLRAAAKSLCCYQQSRANNTAFVTRLVTKARKFKDKDKTTSLTPAVLRKKKKNDDKTGRGNASLSLVLTAFVEVPQSLMGRRQPWQCIALLPVVGCSLLEDCSGGDGKRSRVPTGSSYPSWMLWVHTAILYPLWANFWLKLGALVRY